MTYEYDRDAPSTMALWTRLTFSSLACTNRVYKLPHDPHSGMDVFLLPRSKTVPIWNISYNCSVLLQYICLCDVYSPHFPIQEIHDL